MSVTSYVPPQTSAVVPGAAALAPEALTREDCLHCGLPLPRARKRRGDAFCCAGCERVHALIGEAGLDRYYELRSGPGAPPSPAGSGDFAWLDGLLAVDTGMPADTRGASPPGGIRRLTLDIQGIHCAGCLWILDALFRRHPGGRDLRINPALGRAEIAWGGSLDTLRVWLREAEAFGYRFGPPRKESAAGSSSLLLRLGVTAAAAMNVMVFSLCYYFGLAPEDDLLYLWFGRLSFGLTAIAVATGGWVFFRGSLQGLRRGIAPLDLPIAAGLLLAFAGSATAYLRHGPEAAYFDTVAVFATLMLVGRWLQERILERNRQALLADTGSDHLAARRFENGSLVSIPLREIRPGDELWVVPGDVIPVAGTLLSEGARLRLDWITGESRITEPAPGDLLPAGAVHVGDTAIRCGAAEDFASSRLRDLLERPAPGARDRVRDLWSRFGAVYVAAVFTLALAAFVAWSRQGIDRALLVTTSVLVVTCPCALGLALPLAHELTHLALRRRGIFVRRGDFFERVRAVRDLVFDKTGTLTLGTLVPDPSGLRAFDALTPREQEILWNLAARSNHPVSRALAGALRTQGLRFDPAMAVREIPGRGLTVDLEGVIYRLGSPAFIGSGESGDDPYPRAIFAVGDRPLAVFRFQEHVRDDAREELARLGEEGYGVHILSGDAPERVRSVASRLELPAGRAHGGLAPEEKAAWLRARPPALMVGDGLNDGPAFDAAFACGTPAVEHPALPARADFYFLGEETAAVRRTLAAARRLHRAVRGNLLFALGYNAGALTLCFLGVVTPVVAAVLMPLSSVALVAWTAARLAPGRSSWTS